MHMSYKTLVIKMLICDTVIVATVGFLSLYSLVSSYKEIDKDTVLGAKISAVFFGIVLIISILSSYSRFIDYVRYLYYGDRYINRSVCTVSEHSRSTISGLFGEESFKCVNGEKFYVKYTFRYSRWLWRQVGKEVEVFYLPRSRTVVEIRGQSKS